MKRILVVQLADIGDLVICTPALSALREAHPQAHITLMTTHHAAPVIGGLVDEIIPFERQTFNSSTAFFRPANLRCIIALWRNPYDAVIYFHHFTLKPGTLKFALIGFFSGAKRRFGLENGNGWFLTDRLTDDGYGAKHQAQYWLDLVGLFGAASSPRPAQIKMQPYELPPTTQKRIVIHAGSGGYSLARRWSLQKFAAVADQLHQRYDARIILVGGQNDDVTTVKTLMKSDALDLSGKTSLPQLADVLRQADLYIGADSGVMHIAAAVGIPIVAIFGPSNHLAWSPWSPNGKTVMVRSDVECSPCSYVGHDIGLRDGCDAMTCMKLVTPQQVIQAASDLLDDKTPSHDIIPQSHPAFARRVPMLGIPIDAITYAEWLNLIGQWVKAKDRAHHVCTANPEFLMIAQRDTLFREILKRADLCVPDGVGLLWAGRFKRQLLPERVTGSDGVALIAARAAQEGWRLFLLGAAPGIAEKAAAELQARYPGLQIAGTYSGSPAPHEEDALVERVNASHTDILFVAYGAPVQDKWIARNLPRLNVSMAMGVGGAFDFIAGIIPRAPGWMRRAGLEWLYRLYLQPSRFGRMTRLPRFVLAVLREGR